MSLNAYHKNAYQSALEYLPPGNRNARLGVSLFFYNTINFWIKTSSKILINLLWCFDMVLNAMTTAKYICRGVRQYIINMGLVKCLNAPQSPRDLQFINSPAQTGKKLSFRLGEERVWSLG